MFNALLLSLISPPIVDRRQFVLFMTDGDDTSSSFDGPLAIETARHASAATTVVLVPSRAPVQTRGMLVSVAAQTGARCVTAQVKSKNYSIVARRGYSAPN